MMSGKKRKTTEIVLFALAAAVMLAACGKDGKGENGGSDLLEELAEEDAGENFQETEGSMEDSPEQGNDMAAASGNELEEEATAEEIRERFGEDCISEQTFAVSLSEYDGEVWFVPFASSAQHPQLRMQIMQGGEVLTEIAPYVPERLSGETFSSLDAVSFYDINFDGHTDIVLIETYGSTSFAAVYYGFAEDDGYGAVFSLREELSDNISAQAAEVSVSGIRSFLTKGKKNGEFSDYREAYEAVSTLCSLEGMEEYDLIYFDDDETPELAAENPGYDVSLYTYEDGTVYMLMDRWAYGAMGNAGYEYCPGKNSLRNYNSDYAGAIMYTTYMEADGQHSMDTVTEIKTYNFDDVNGNGVPDPEEEGSMGTYSVSYIGGREISEEECAAFAAGEYVYIEPCMSLEQLRAQLK